MFSDKSSELGDVENYEEVKTPVQSKPSEQESNRNQNLPAVKNFHKNKSPLMSGPLSERDINSCVWTVKDVNFVKTNFND